MSLSAPVLAAGLWLAFAVAQPAPVPIPPIEKARAPAPADAGKCMWEQFPAPVRSSVLNKPTLEEVYAELGARAEEMGNDGITTAGRACRLTDAQFESAGSRVAGWVGRIWAEKQLAGRLTPLKIDQVYRGISTADRQALQKGFAVRGGIHESPAKEAFDRYLAGLGIARAEENAFIAATAYLVSRMGDDEDAAAGR